MARFIEDTFDTGIIAAGSSLTLHRPLPANKINIGKIKVVASAIITGYAIEIFKKATALPIDRQYASRNPVNINPYVDPVSRSGEEVLEGFIIPYDDMSGLQQLHVKISNRDPADQSYAVSIWYESYALTSSSYVDADLSAQSGTAITLPSTPAAGTFSLFRGGLLQEEGAAADYTRVGAALTMAIPVEVGERFRAKYIES